MNAVNIGFGNIVPAERIIAVIGPESAPVKRMVQDAREQGLLVDATFGRKTRTVLIMDSQHIILSSVALETVAGRLGGSHVGQ